jgi:hypothetical protein
MGESEERGLNLVCAEENKFSAAAKVVQLIDLAADVGSIIN